MVFFGKLAVVTAAYFWIALALYMGGRVVFPDVGLTAPDYRTWLKVTYVLGAFGYPIYILSSIFKGK